MIRPGLQTPEFPTVPSLLSKKSFLLHNILVGNDTAQIRFAEQILNVPCKAVDRVQDEDVLVPTPTLHQVFMSSSIDLSPQIRDKTGVWSLAPLIPGSASTTAVVKAACEILSIKLEPAKRNRACEILTEEPINDVRAALWSAVWIVADDIPEKEPFWKDPWSSNEWLSKNTDPVYRLNSLYRDLVGYVLIHDNDEVAVRKFGISPTKSKRLKGMNLNLDCVYDSILELSKWRHKRYNPYFCAIAINKIWRS
jgi:hypothetical protein